jgi:predicted PurR-regulated permease PerM
VAASVLGVAVAAFLVGPNLLAQIDDLVVQLPDAMQALRSRIEQTSWAQQMVQSGSLWQRLIPNPVDLMGGVTSAFSATLGVVTNAAIILFIGLYGAASPQTYVEGVIRMVPLRHRRRARDVIAALGKALRWWLVGRLAMMVVVGLLTGVGLWLAGVPSAGALGFIAALLSFVPYVGPLLSVVPALMVALTTSSAKVSLVILVYGIVQAMESYLITPLVQRRAVSIPPATLIVAQLAMGVLAGAPGIFLATPLAVSIIVILQILYVEDVLGDSVHVLGQHGHRAEAHPDVHGAG